MDVKKEFKFSPSFSLEAVTTRNVIKAFKERIENYYFKPIKKLLKKKEFGFAATTLLASFIDILDKTSRHDKTNNNNKYNYIESLKNNFKFTPNIAKYFYENIRCGLVHSGCIESGGKISYTQSSLCRSVDDYLIINPKKLFSEIEKIFNYFIANEDPKAFFNYLTERLDEL